jgi:D-sedoheptulose 7-phosphate isomerase
MSTLDRLFSESNNLADYAQRYAGYVAALLQRLDHAAIARVGNLLDEARRLGNTIFIIGNGGSASTASHFACDLALGPRVYGGKAYKAVSLCDNNALLTAAANDLGYDAVFAEQLRTQFEAGDMVLAISASGNSPNIIRAVEYANAEGGITVGFTGFDGGQLRQIAREHVHVPTPHGDYGPVEDLHLVLNHLIASYLVRLTSEERDRELAFAGVRLRRADPPPAVRPDLL